MTYDNIVRMIDEFPVFEASRLRRAFDESAGRVAQASAITGATRLEDLIPDFPGVIRARGTYTLNPGESWEGYDNDNDYPVIVINTRQGGGNNECYCETLDDECEPWCMFANNLQLEHLSTCVMAGDESSDCTYRWFVFDVGDISAQIDTVNKNIQIVSKSYADKQLLDGIESGELPVTALLVSPWDANKAVEELRRAQNSLGFFDTYDEKFIRDVKTLEDFFASVLESLADAKPIDVEFPDSISSEVLALVNKSRIVTFVDMASNIENYNKEARRLVAASRAEEEFLALPDNSGLRALLGDTTQFEKLTGDIEKNMRYYGRDIKEEFNAKSSFSLAYNLSQVSEKISRYSTALEEMEQARQTVNTLGADML